MYLINNTRPGITYVVGRLSRSTQCTNEYYQIAIDRLARYLIGTIGYELKYDRSLPILEMYNDANWISKSNEIKSTSGYIFTLGGGALSWKSSKQTHIARFTIESKLITLETACI